MSSLRLALKQSLQETGHLAPDGDKKKRKKGKRNAVDSIKNKRGTRPGEPPRGNNSIRGGRSRKLTTTTTTSTSPDGRVGEGDDRMNATEDGRGRMSLPGERQGSSSSVVRSPGEYSSSENEFSYDDDEEVDSHSDGGDDDDEEGGGRRRGRDYDEDDDDDDDEEGEEEEDDDMHSDEEDPEDIRQYNKVDGMERPKHATTTDPDGALTTPASSSTTSPQTKGPATGDRSNAGYTEKALQSSSQSEHPQVPRTKSLKAQGQEDTNSDEELRKKRKLLKKKLKHSAAHKIQNQWKKKKHEYESTIDERIPGDHDRPGSHMNDITVTGRDSQKSKPPAMGSVKETSPPTRTGRRNDRDDDESMNEPDETVTQKKKKKKGDGVVPAPTADVLEWTRAMSEKKCRKNVATGLRVKVRFATKVKLEGKMVKKKIWYGGRVAAVSKMGSKIRIKYDDGTSEISKFPDKDVVVDAVMNGEHSVFADRFIPPVLEDDKEEYDFQPSEVQMSSKLDSPTGLEASTEIEASTGLEALKEIEASTELDTLTGLNVSQEDATLDLAEPEPTKMETLADGKEGETIGAATGSEMELTGDQALPSSTEVQKYAQLESRPPSQSDTPVIVGAASPSRGGSDVELHSEKNAEPDKNSEMEINITIPQAPLTPPRLMPSMDEVPIVAEISRKSPEAGMQPEEPPVVRSIPPPPSPEEGELSPGITVHKQCVPDSSELEAIPLPLASADQEQKCDIPSESQTEVNEMIDGAEPVSNEPMSSTPVQDHQESESPSKDAPSIAAPKPKLAIRLTNLGGQAGMSSFRATPPPEKDVSVDKILGGQAGMSSFRATPPPEKDVSVDKILVDTPVLEEGSKRKRTPQGEGDDEEAPPKRRIRVSLGKLEEKISKEKAHIASVETMLVKNEENDPSSALDKDDLTNSANAPNVLKEFSDETSEMIETKPVPTVVEKKKKKKADRQKSPKPSIPKRESSPGVASDHLIESQRSDSEIKTAKPNASQSGEASDAGGSSRTSTPALKPHGASKSTALSAGKKSLQPGKGTPDDTGNTLKPPKSQSSMESVGSGAASRMGRKAAQEAKGKLSIKEKDNELPIESGKKKKKRKRTDDAEVDVGGESDVSNETEWVQCDSCGKWRILPDDVKVSSLPNKWYCHMNSYDPKRSSCTNPEQSPKQALKERKKARKRAKRMELVEVESIQEDLKKEKQQILATPVNSPKPAKVVKSGIKVKEIVDPRKVVPVLAEDQSHPSDSGSETQKEERKKGKKIRVADSSVAAEVSDAAADAKKPGRKRGRPARSQTTSTPLSAQESRDEDNVEWVQCEKCEKWRKLPPDISADELPDTWYCSMNTWNPLSASCLAAEDETDSQHHEIGSSEWQLRQSHAGKYSYRQMIFGTGAKKHNRPMSERSRAAESLFMRQTEDDENPHPSVMYSKSSCFLPRTSNFNKTNALEENTLGIFDVLSNSNLWAELRRIDAAPTKVESNSGGQSYPKFATYENLPDDIKNAMHEVVLNVLGTFSLTGDNVIGECQRYPWDTSTGDVVDIRGYCNTDVIINTLLALVRDGIVEMTCLSDPTVPISQWVPKYRRVRSRRALEAVEAIKASRCMKIAKPWKHREEKSSNWMSGKGAFY